jgi:predicted nucleic acid-binding protein
LSSQNNHIEELIISFVKVVVDKAYDDDMREENEIGEEAENGKSHGLIVD